MSDLIERLWASDEASALTNEAARELEKHQWVSVDERLPPVSDRNYMVMTEFWEEPRKMHFALHDGVAYWDGMNSEKHHLISKPGHRITDWQPLPDPPGSDEG